MAFRYTLRLSDGTDAGKYETAEPTISRGDEIRIDGNRLVRVLAVIPVALVGEFVDGPTYGVLEIDPVA